MKVLVTGGAGFIGSHIVDRLIESNYKLVIVDNLSTGYKKNINPKAEFYHADIKDLRKLKSIFKIEAFEKVVHAAAQIKVEYSVENPINDALINIIGGLNVLECCRIFNVKKIVYLSTGGALYGNPDYVPVDEKHPIRPISPYGVSKHAMELYLYDYLINFGLEFTSLRFSNVYGPRDYIESRHVIPLFIHHFLKNEQPYITGDGSQGRDFIYVKDVVDAIIKALDTNSKDKILNIGTGKINSIKDLFNIIATVMNKKIEPRYINERKGDVKQIYLDPRKAEKQLGWKAKTTLQEGLKETIKWYKEK